MRVSGFTHGFGEPIPKWVPLTPAEKTAGVMSASAPELFEPVELYGNRHDPSSNAARLRRALVGGAKSTVQLSAMTGISTRALSSYIANDILAGRVVADKTGRPYLYMLAKEAVCAPLGGMGQ